VGAARRDRKSEPLPVFRRPLEIADDGVVDPDDIVQRRCLGPAMECGCMINRSASGRQGNLLRGTRGARALVMETVHRSGRKRRQDVVPALPSTRGIVG
jgi:hypothetical protein